MYKQAFEYLNTRMFLVVVTDFSAPACSAGGGDNFSPPGGIPVVKILDTFKVNTTFKFPKFPNVCTCFERQVFPLFLKQVLGKLALFLKILDFAFKFKCRFFSASTNII